MNTVILYTNSSPYPFYSDTIDTYKTVQATPRHQDLRSGYIDMQLTMNDIFGFNYLSFTRDSKTIYAWVENIEERGGNKLWRVHYSTDPLRTYMDNLVLGTQYIARSTTPTNLEDELLSSNREYNDYSVTEYSIGDPSKRYAVVQLTRWPDASTTSYSNTPAHPSPYDFFFVSYDVNNWKSSTPLLELMEVISGAEGESSNVVTVYSVPHVALSSGMLQYLNVRVAGKNTPINNWYQLGDDVSGLFTTYTSITFPENITKTSHSIKLLFPEAGIMDVPDELISMETDIRVRQDVDIFSGACNYMLAIDEGATPTHLSVRGSSLSTIPILSNPYENYISQNQNTLAVGLLGDVASIGLGIGTGNPLLIGGGARGLLGTVTGLADAKNAIPSNPPAFLGSALVPYFNQKFYMIVTSKHYDNEVLVRARYGYPQHRLGALYIPANGFIQTNNCSVSSDGTVPLWAIHEINQLFNAGLLFQ